MQHDDVESGSAPHQNLAVCLRSDTIGLLARRALDHAGITHIVLKGRSFARLLYDSDWERVYRDTDLLVSPGDVARAGAVLTTARFARPDRDYLTLPPHYAQFWIHQDTGVPVDLHWSLPGVKVDAARVWAELSERTMILDVGGTPATVLDGAATAFLCALHAARHGPRFPSPLADLERALTRIESGSWAQAVILAQALQAEGPLAAGMALLPDGKELAARFGLSTRGSTEMWIKKQDDPRLWSALFVDSIINSKSMGAAARELLRWAFPPAPAMRARYDWAGRGKRALTAAYVVRFVHGPSRLGKALATWARARLSMKRRR